MARSHHRKKHKQSLKQFKTSHDTATAATASRNRVSGKWMFAVAGLILGVAIGYFASGAMTWVAIGAIAGTAIGFLIGKKIDDDRTF
jgi:hypothetical protein